MRRSEILTLFDYNYWANARVLEAAAMVGETQFTAPARLSHGSLRGCLVHILSAEWVWRLRCQEGISPVGLLAEADYLNLESLRERWQAEEGTMRAFLSGLDGETLAQPVKYTTTRGQPFETILWHLLVHVVNHGTQFRAEAAVVLTEYGQSPGDLDFILFLRGQS